MPAAAATVFNGRAFRELTSVSNNLTPCSTDWMPFL
jgi:hypothetical protein